MYHYKKNNLRKFWLVKNFSPNYVDLEKTRVPSRYLRVLVGRGLGTRVG